MVVEKDHASGGSSSRRAPSGDSLSPGAASPPDASPNDSLGSSPIVVRDDPLDDEEDEDDDERKDTGPLLRRKHGAGGSDTRLPVESDADPSAPMTEEEIERKRQMDEDAGQKGVNAHWALAASCPLDLGQLRHASATLRTGAHCAISPSVSLCSPIVQCTSSSGARCAPIVLST